MAQAADLDVDAVTYWHYVDQIYTGNPGWYKYPQEIVDLGEPIGPNGEVSSWACLGALFRVLLRRFDHRVAQGSGGRSEFRLSACFGRFFVLALHPQDYQHHGRTYEC